MYICVYIYDISNSRPGQEPHSLAKPPFPSALLCYVLSWNIFNALHILSNCFDLAFYFLSHSMHISTSKDH